MTSEITREETYDGGAYLRAFAESLTVRGLAKCEEGKWSNVYSFRECYLMPDLVVTVRETGGSLYGLIGLIVTLRGSEEHIDAFIRAAGSELDKGISSREYVLEERKIRSVPKLTENGC